MPAPAPCLLVLRHQVDVRWPHRSRRSDGIMGDPSHQARKSDHNLGNAIDLTADPTSGFDVDALAEALRSQMKTARAGRVSYLIRNRLISSPEQGWLWRPYFGPNPHTTHLHISIRADRRHIIRQWTI